MDTGIGTRTTARPEAASRATMGASFHRSRLDPGGTNVTARSSRSLMAAVRGEVCREPTADRHVEREERRLQTRVELRDLSGEVVVLRNTGELTQDRRDWIGGDGTLRESDARQEPQCGDGHHSRGEQQPCLA